ncbi:hypothetical protein ACFLU6_05215, partial [Acidobacteriota bacterium]
LSLPKERLESVAFSLSDSPGTYYGRNADTTAELAQSLDLSSWPRVYLLFSHRFWIDNDFDAARIEISTDGGNSWTGVAGEDSDVPSGVGRQTPDAPVYDGRIYEWTEERVDLSAFAGPGNDNVRIRFRMLSDGAIGLDGWLIDDVRIVGFTGSADRKIPNDPYPLFLVRSGDDVELAWPPVQPDPNHDVADAYIIYRTPWIKADRGFIPVGTVLDATGIDPFAISAPSNYAYRVVATNCAGNSSEPPP